jgi:hypothetical protein
MKVIVIMLNFFDVSQWNFLLLALMIVTTAIYFAPMNWECRCWWCGGMLVFTVMHVAFLASFRNPSVSTTNFFIYILLFDLPFAIVLSRFIQMYDDAQTSRIWQKEEDVRLADAEKRRVPFLSKSRFNWLYHNHNLISLRKIMSIPRRYAPSWRHKEKDE